MPAKSTIDNGRSPNTSSNRSEYHTGLTDRLRSYFQNTLQPGDTRTMVQIAKALNLYDDIYHKKKVYDRSYQAYILEDKIANKKAYSRLNSKLNKLIDEREIDRLDDGLYTPIHSTHDQSSPHGSANGRSRKYRLPTNSQGQISGRIVRSNGRSRGRGGEQSKHATNIASFEEIDVTRVDIAATIDQLQSDPRLNQFHGINFVEGPRMAHKIRMQSRIPLKYHYHQVPGTDIKLIFDGEDIRASNKRPGIDNYYLQYIWGYTNGVSDTQRRFAGLDDSGLDQKITLEDIEIRNIHRLQGSVNFNQNLKNFKFLDLEVFANYAHLIGYREDNQINKEIQLWNLDEPADTIFRSMMTAKSNLENEVYFKHMQHRFTRVMNRVVSDIGEKLDFIAENYLQALGTIGSKLDTIDQIEEVRKELVNLPHQLNESLQEIKVALTEEMDAASERHSAAMEVEEKQTNILERQTEILGKFSDKVFEMEEGISVVENSVNDQVTLLKQVQSSNKELSDKLDNSLDGRSQGELVLNKSTVRLKDVVKRIKTVSNYKKKLKQILTLIKLKPGIGSTEIVRTLGFGHEYGYLMIRYLEKQGWIAKDGDRHRGFKWRRIR